jgi:phosphate transport system protein
MSAHFQELLQNLQGRLARMTALVAQSAEWACESLVTMDERLAAKVRDQDVRIDDEEVQIEKDAIGLLALHQPAAVDLRRITTIIKVNGDFERIADCSVNIAQRVPLIKKIDGYKLPADVKTMFSEVTDTLRETIRAFNLSDELLAWGVIKGDDTVDALYQSVVQEVLSGLDGATAAQHVANLMIAKNLERIGDHCTNIAENVVYVHTGRIIRHQHAVL